MDIVAGSRSLLEVSVEANQQVEVFRRRAEIAPWRLVAQFEDGRAVDAKPLVSQLSFIAD